MDLSIIILAAGKGTRMQSSISKVLHKIGNFELIKILIDTAKTLNPKEISIVCSEENINEINKIINNDEKIKTIIQKERLGTGNATKIGYKILENKNSNILIMYGDEILITINTYQKVLNLLNNTNASIVDLAFYTNNIENKYGRLIVNNDNLEKIIEYKDATEEVRSNNLCNSGILAIKSNLLDNLLTKIKNDNLSEEYYLTDIIEIAIKENKICKYVIADEEEVIGINSKLELSVAERIFQDRKRKEFMLKGVTLVDPNSVYFSYDTEIEKDVIIEPNVIFFKNVKIKSNVVIHSFSYLENCTIEENVSIGPFARIRPETVINKNSKIGNFVEVKKSLIGENTKINHLTYIGDSTIGNNTNIGANSITCNYDGFNKSETKIGDNCFIGSNTTMIAPLKIENNSIIGAGSVITKNVNENDIAISRIEQVNLKEKAILYRKKRGNKKNNY